MGRTWKKTARGSNRYENLGLCWLKAYVSIVCVLGGGEETAKEEEDKDKCIYVTDRRTLGTQNVRIKYKHHKIYIEKNWLDYAV